VTYQAILPPEWVGRWVNHEPDPRQVLMIPTVVLHRPGPAADPLPARSLTALAQPPRNAILLPVTPWFATKYNLSPSFRGGRPALRESVVANDTVRRAQVNTRLEQHAHDVVCAIAFIDGTSEADVVRQAVESLVAQRERENDVQDALRLIAKRKSRRTDA
jgi:hypothetical protein